MEDLHRTFIKIAKIIYKGNSLFLLTLKLRFLHLQPYEGAEWFAERLKENLKYQDCLKVVNHNFHLPRCTIYAANIINLFSLWREHYQMPGADTNLFEPVTAI